MKVITIMGILLAAVGVISLIYQGLPFTTREKVIDFGPVQAYREKEENDSAAPNHRRVGHRGWNPADRRRSQEEVIPLESLLLSNGVKPPLNHGRCTAYHFFSSCLLLSLLFEAFLRRLLAFF